MINNKSVLAKILARKQSKRLPNKNIKLFTDKPLISWTIKAAKKSKYIDRVIVSTNSKKTALISKKYVFSNKNSVEVSKKGINLPTYSDINHKDIDILKKYI